MDDNHYYLIAYTIALVIVVYSIIKIVKYFFIYTKKILIAIFKKNEDSEEMYNVL